MCQVSFVETPSKFIIAKLSIRNLGFVSSNNELIRIFIKALTKLRAYGAKALHAITNLRAVFTKLN